MTPDDLKAARARLGMKASELGRALELEGRDPGQQVLRWEAAKAAIPGPARVAIRYMLEELDRTQAQAHAPPPVVDLADPTPAAVQLTKTRRRG